MLDASSEPKTPKSQGNSVTHYCARHANHLAMTPSMNKGLALVLWYQLCPCLLWGDLKACAISAQKVCVKFDIDTQNQLCCTLFDYTNGIHIQTRQTRRKASDICLRSLLDICSHTFSRWCPETQNMISFSQSGTIMRKMHRAWPKCLETPNLTCFIKTKLVKSTNYDHNLISSEDDQGTSACKISGHLLNTCQFAVP